MGEAVTIEIDDIYLDTRNPRFENEQKNQRAALEKIVDAETIALARHIAKHGLNPLERMAVFFDEKYKKHVTAEGNRRLAALKLLNNFSLLDSLKVSPPIKSELKKTPKSILSNLKKVPCVLFETRSAPAIWVKLKHTGKNSGVGTVQWNRKQQQRFDTEYLDHKPPQLQLLDFLRAEFQDDKVISAKLAEDFPMTPLERLVGDPEVREFLGIELEDKHLYASLEKSEILKGFKKIIFDLTEPDRRKRVTTRTLNVKTDRRDYLETFRKSEIPSHKKSIALWSLDALTTPENTDKELKKSKPTPSTENRKKLITPSCVLSIKDNQRVNDIYHNLKNDLDVEKYANAVSVLARLFIEMSVNHYLANSAGKTETEIQSRSYSLDKKISDVVNDLKLKGNITVSAKQSIGKEMGNSNSAFHPNSLNAFVHNPNFHPSALDLKRGWNNIEPLIIGIWE